MIILCTAGKQIIAYADAPWTTPGEYEHEAFRIVLCDAEPGAVPVAIAKLGAKTSRAFATWRGEVVCSRVHESATVEFAESK